MKICPKCSFCYDDDEVICSNDGVILENTWPTSRLIAGKYILKAKIASGGMGVIYKAIQSELNREVAVKILSPQYLSKERIIKQFHREALAVARLDHVNITPIYDYGALPGNYGAYLVMRLVNGKRLSEEIDELGSIPLERALRIMQQICAGVSAAHAQKVIHCDLKPDNILLEYCGTLREKVQIVDFGISKLREFSVDEGSLGGSAITDSAIGTPQYMSPEQCCGEPITSQTDIYSAGIIFFEMITGRVPFSGLVPVEIAQHHVRTPPPPPSRFRPGISVALDYAVLRSLAKRASGRPENLEQFFDELLQASGVTLPLVVDAFASGSFLNLSSIVPTLSVTDLTNPSERSSFEAKDAPVNLEQAASNKNNKILTENSESKSTRHSKNITAHMQDSKTNPFVDFKTEIKPNSSEPFFPEMMVLVVDDGDITDVLHNLLQDFGTTVISATDSEEAWKCIEKYAFNLVISNVFTKKVNAWQLLARSQDLQESPLFIFVTDKPTNEDRLQALELGVEDYWASPLPVAEAQIRLRRLLQRIRKDLA